ncbi:hypothetical protein C2E21_5286 [Chlorella sorokiniana]|uniref:Uncharacterized protein n=1 Tax=Chlorella sorokiniana TaxID=3076 RepID=A0A2P6TPX1_CHLSO|nr:hypothetical protein C2E21_5286 [Chlorella sorokiniana]|eukprot:PRW56080.1 hypothetical protein C2E21_5286 [Chlorella sorokiniana]
MDVGGLMQKAKESGAVEKAVDSMVTNKDKLVAGIGQAAGAAGMDASARDTAVQKVEAALGDGAGLKASLNAQLDKAAGGAAAAGAPAADAPAAEQ